MGKVQMWAIKRKKNGIWIKKKKWRKILLQLFSTFKLCECGVRWLGFNGSEKRKKYGKNIRKWFENFFNAIFKDFLQFKVKIISKISKTHWEFSSTT
jgi:hypothetical protein